MNNRTQIRLGLFIGILVLGLTTFLGSLELRHTKSVVPFLYGSPVWADSVYIALNNPNRFGQLILIKSVAQNSFTQLAQQVKEVRPGGVIFDQYPLAAQREIAKVLQEESPIPLMIGMQSPAWEIGLTGVYPVGSVRADSTASRLGKVVAEQARLSGAHLLIGPPLTCGPYSDTVLSRYLNFMKPLGEENLLTTFAFTCKDSLTRKDTSKVFFDEMIASGISGMVFHPKFLRRPIEETTRSYNGLVIVEVPDSLTGNTRYIGNLLRNGVDFFVVNDSAARLALTLRNLARRDAKLNEILGEHLRRILLAKSWAFFPKKKKKAVKTNRRTWYFRTFNEENTVLIKNEDAFLPIREIHEKRFALMQIGKPAPRFQFFLEQYVAVRQEPYRRKADSTMEAINVRRLRRYDCLFVTLSETEVDSLRDSLFLKSLKELSPRTKVVIVNFRDLERLPILHDFPVLLHAWNVGEKVEDVPAQMIFGGLPTKGRLPVTLGPGLPEGMGLQTKVTRLGFELPEIVGLSQDTLREIDSIVAQSIRLKAFPGCQVLIAKKGKVVYYKSFGHHTYGQRRAVQLTDLYDIASVTKIAATTLATMYMHENQRINLNSQLKEFFQDTNIILDSLKPDEVLYTADTLKKSSPADSSGKTLVAAIENPDEIHFKPITLTLSGTSNIFLVRIKDLLTHHSGLPPSMPILPYLRYTDRGLPRYGKYFSSVPSDKYPVEVADEFYLRKDFRDSIWFALKHLPLFNNSIYEYSDVNMVLVQQALDSINQQPMDEFLAENIYGPLGLQTARFRPRNTLPARRITPTENDQRWRGNLLRGYVHDPAAALMGGVSGNAGLFSNALDLGVIAQLWLNQGTYGGQTFFSPTTAQLFTQTHQGHRGYGFDKPPKDTPYFIGDLAGKNSYGHTGFTGTCIWVDPDEDLVYIFLSNRVYPSANNWRINTYRVRQRIHDVVYRAMVE